MVRKFKPEDMENLVMDVFLEDGQVYKGADVTPDPFGQFESLLSFWVDDSIVIKPMSKVSGAVLRVGEKKDD
jgi:hypothetical protein